jgi:hypothetical protein
VNARHRLGPRGRQRLSVVALIVGLSGAFVASAAAHANSLHVKVAGSEVTVSGFAAKRETLNVLFDPNLCAATFKAESRRAELSSFGDKVKGHFSGSFGPGQYLPSIARYVCVYVQTLSPLNPKTIEKASAELAAPS